MNKKLQKLLDLYQELKQFVQTNDKHLFERWKAGGFLIDENIVSSYPNIVQVFEQLDEEETHEETDE